MSGPALPALTSVLERARSVGFLGPGPVEDHVEHAGLFRQALDGLGDGGFVGRAVDIGAGGGVPGLVLLATVPQLELVLLDAAQKRCAFLVWAVAELEVSDRADVW
ncbi:MAG: RsmG family class I SAM-dependent methyltransferase, partial [Actinomycetota bacterium]